MRYLDFLATVHRLLRPSTYLEIGIRNGVSLSLSQCRSIGVDPNYQVTAELDGDFALFRTSSDEYFSRPDPLAATRGIPFDLSFIDGLHLFEFALRDFINAERHSSARSVIIFDDVMPRSIDEAARVRHTKGWTGDVYAMVEVLARFRPELTVLPVGTKPTGLLLVLGLDPDNTTLADNYQALVAEYRRPDPQPVPVTLLDRLSILSPQRVLAADFWDILAGTDRSSSADAVRPALAERLGRTLGPAFGARGGHHESDLQAVPPTAR
ncbi:hypothetical protein GCM10009841_23120 [Microlunatus panaciterrae]|uniref:Methyltransferase domain-containing protein n=1 Tax=Microlunatus panaciterrae TaxID=400768 RepID=A0ABS2RGY8_9ACTN|nr:class I SAM-dependent methyltransferase [Microlunatus panaciterrae]MBM7797194.1 hypothetical protein [Microlunatus panaciterrae]